jgi:hypothetical protein
MNANFCALSGNLRDELGVTMQDHCWNKKRWLGVELLQAFGNSVERSTRPPFGEAKACKDGPETP